MKFREYMKIDELFYAMAAAVGGASAKKTSQVHKTDPRINDLIFKITQNNLYKTDPESAIDAIAKSEKLDKKTTKYLKKLFRI